LRRRKKRDLLTLALAGRGEQQIVSDPVGIDTISLKEAFEEAKGREGFSEGDTHHFGLFG
jgi:hypothetical protein